MDKNINRYDIPKKYGDKMLSLINRFHYEGNINMVKTDIDISFTVISETEADFYDMLPCSSLSPKILDPVLFIRSKKFIGHLKDINKKGKKIDIKNLNLNLINILTIISNIEFIEKLLVIKDVCIYIGYSSRVYRINTTTIIKYSPYFNIFKGFNTKLENETEILNKSHNLWLETKKDPNNKIFASDILE